MQLAFVLWYLGVGLTAEICAECVEVVLSWLFRLVLPLLQKNQPACTSIGPHMVDLIVTEALLWCPLNFGVCATC